VLVALCQVVSAAWLQPVLLLLSAMLLGLGLWAVPLSQKRFRTNDPSEVVIDEALGITAASALFPGALLVSNGLVCIGLCLFFFRVFDILKPGPVAWLEMVPGAWGVMLDDLMAGVAAGCCALACIG